MRLVILVIFFPFLLCAEPHYWEYVNELGAQQDLYFHKKYDLTPCMSGGGGANCVTEVGRGYAAPYPVDISYARVIILDIINHYAQAINCHVKIRQFLKEYPFPISRLKLEVSFEENPNLPKSEKQIIFVFLQNNKIYYRYDTHTYKEYESYYEETFAEANAIVEMQKKDKELLK